MFLIGCAVPSGLFAGDLGQAFAEVEDGVTTNGAATPSSFLDLIKKLRSQRAAEEGEGVEPAFEPTGVQELGDGDGRTGEGGDAGDAASAAEPGSVPGKGQPEARAEGTGQAEGPPGVVSSGTAEAVVADDQGVRFNFDDADIFEVVRTVLGDILAVNYLIDPAVSGRVNFRSTSVIPREGILPLLQTILRLNGIGIVEEAALYRVIPLGNVPREPAEVRFGRSAEVTPLEGRSIVQVVPLRYRESQEMVAILAPYLSQGAQATEVPKSNYVVIADSDENVRRLLGLIDLFDSDELASAEPQVFVYNVQNGKAKDVAAILKEIFLGQSRQTSPSAGAKKTSAGGNTPFGAKADPKKTAKPLPRKAPGVAAGKGGAAIVAENTRIFADEITNAIIIMATPADYGVIEGAIRQIDIVPRQVLIEVLAAEVILSEDLQFGFEWYLETKFKVGNTDLVGFPAFNSQGAIGGDVGTEGTIPFPENVFSFAMLDTSGIVRAFLQTIASENKAKVLASPHIVVSDNKEATINVGQDVPTVTSETNVTGTTDIQNTIQYRQVGVSLTVNPQINEGGLVALDISTEVSSLSEERVEGVDSPLFNSQTASSHVVVQDGQTVVMGGMIREDRSHQEAGIPLLKDIPYLGNAFKSTKENVRRLELVFLITPRVIRDQEEARMITEGISRRVADELGEMMVSDDPAVGVSVDDPAVGGDASSD